MFADPPADELALPPRSRTRGATWKIVAIGVALGLVPVVIAIVVMSAGDDATDTEASAAAAPAGAPAPVAVNGAARGHDDGSPASNAANGERVAAHASPGDDLLHIGEPPSWIAHTARPRRIRRARAALARAYRYDARGDLDSAEAWLRRANHLRPEHAGTASLLARNLEAQGRHDEARAWAEHAIELAPLLAYPYYHRGRVEEAQENEPSAVDSYHEALQRNPHERRTRRRLRTLEE